MVPSDVPPKKQRPRKHKQDYLPAYVNQDLGDSVRKQALFWLGALAFFIIFLFIFSSILLPFVVGFALAYFVNPVVELLSKFGISRPWTTVLITICIIVGLVVALTIIVPVIGSQLQAFITVGVPTYADRIQKFFDEHNFEWMRKYLGSDPTEIQSNIQALFGQSSDIVKSLLGSLLDSGKSLLDIFSLFIVAPVVAFYLLLDWRQMVDNIDSWIPRAHVATVRSIFYEMDRSIAGFIRGQGTVCLIIAIYYATGLTISGLNFGLSIGLFVGLISFIPYIGSMSGFILAVWVAWVQYYPDNWAWVVVVMCIFFVGQFVEGYILQPKLVGSSVGLHPVWLMFALFAFGSLFGFTGMLVAVPAAAAIGVLVRFALHTYLASPLYLHKKAEND